MRGPASTTPGLVIWMEYLRIHVAVLRLGNAIDVPALGRLYQVCERAGLSTELADQVMSSLEGYDRDATLAAIRALRSSELRFTLLADYCELARAARIERLSDEPLLHTLSSILGITAAQHDAIAGYIETADAHPDNPWRDEITEVRAALARVERAGASVLAVSGTQSPLSLGARSAAAAFAGLTELCADVRDAASEPSTRAGTSEPDRTGLKARTH